MYVYINVDFYIYLRLLGLRIYCTLGDSPAEVHHLPLPECTNSKLTCQQCWFLLRNIRESLLCASPPASGGLLAIAGAP